MTPIKTEEVHYSSMPKRTSGKGLVLELISSEYFYDNDRHDNHNEAEPKSHGSPW